jgi:ArsR family transcriptional regulator, arsenate/arsenite/antimonite-responsive transcriptional repressor
MGITKSDYFTPEQNETALLFKALGHPARMAIIEYLLKAKSCICGDLVNELPLAQPTISQHLKELKQVGIIQGTIEGNSICYCLNPKTIEQLESLLGDWTEQLRITRSSCC